LRKANADHADNHADNHKEKSKHDVGVEVCGFEGAGATPVCAIRFATSYGGPDTRVCSYPVITHTHCQLRVAAGFSPSPSDALGAPDVLSALDVLQRVVTAVASFTP